MLLHSVPNHPFIGKVLFDPTYIPGGEFLGVIKEVSDDGKGYLYLMYTYDDDGINYKYIPRQPKTTEEGCIIWTI